MGPRISRAIGLDWETMRSGVRCAQNASIWKISILIFLICIGFLISGCSTPGPPAEPISAGREEANIHIDDAVATKVENEILTEEGLKEVEELEIGAEPAADAKLAQASVVHAGSDALMMRAMKKAKEEGRLTIGFIGGSITQGASATASTRNYAALTAQWWRDKFPGAEISAINAGIGATGTYIAVHRLQADLLVHKPDIVIIDFAVNDAPSPHLARQYEGLVRRILQAENRPGVILLSMLNRDGTNMQEVHESIGYHYDLPMLSAKNALWTELEAGQLQWETLYADNVHPNDAGHKLLAAMVVARLEQAYAKLETAVEDQLTPVALPEPLTEQGYSDANLLRAGDVEPLGNTGWETGGTFVFTEGWRATEPGAQLVFEVNGSNIGVVYSKLSNGRMGRALAQVDDLSEVVLEGHFSADWEGYPAAQQLARDLADGPHTIKITFLEDHHEASTGSEFHLSGILVAR